MSVEGAEDEVLVIKFVLVLPVLFGWRLRRTGLYASDAGIRDRSALRTWTVPWSDIAAFDIRADSEQLKVAVGGFTVAKQDVPLQEVWVQLRDGGVRRTRLRFQGATIDFLPSDRPGGTGSFLTGVVAQPAAIGLAAVVQLRTRLREARQTS